MKRLIISVILCAFVGYWVGYFSAEKRVDKAYLAGAIVGATGMCWHLTFVGNERCEELAERLR